jgi:predicted secreted protein
MSLICALLAVAALALPATAAAKLITVTEKDNGKTVSLAQGERLLIKLTECRPCGYHWDISGATGAPVLKRTSSRYVEAPGPAIGGPGKRLIRYSTRRAGQTALKLVYLSPGGDKAKTFRLKVKVRSR